MNLWAQACALLLVSVFSVTGVHAEAVSVGFGEHRPPYVFAGESRGLEYELFAAAAQAGGMHVDAHFGPNARQRKMLDEDGLDALSSMYLPAEIDAHFSEPYVTYHDMAVALAERQLSITSVDDLASLSVSSFKHASRLLGEQFKRMAAVNPAYREERRQLQRNLLLYAKRVDVVVGDPLIIAFFNSEVAGQVDTRQPVRWYPIFAPLHYRGVFREAEQRDRFNYGLSEIRRNGTYARIEAHYKESLKHVYPQP